MSTLTSPVDIRADHLEIVQDILRTHLPAGVKVWVFGSRANWTTKDSSDLDLAVAGPSKLDYRVMADLEIAFEESDIPYTVDVVDLNAVSSEFREIVEVQKVPLLLTGSEAHGRREWREASLGEVIEFKRGYDLPQRNRVPGVAPIVSSSGITDWHSEAKVKGPGVVTGRYGTLGEIYFIEDDFWPLNTALYVRDFKGNDPRFISYFLHGLDFFAYSDKAAVPGLNRNHLHQATVRYPTDIEEQRAIAHILGTLDDKIELNRRMSQTLEKMARAIFQDWFVDFGPVRAKLEGREPYLPPALWSLFPDRLVDSQLGEIPEGWDVKPLSDCVDVARGLSYKGSGLGSTGMLMHNLNSVYEGGGYKEGGIKYYSGDYRERHVSQPGDVLVANTEQGHDRLLIGFAAIVPERFGEQGLFSHHLYRIRPTTSSGISPDYICQLLNTLGMHDTISGYATGTTVNMLPVDALCLPAIVLPPDDLVKFFTAIAETTRARQEDLIEESRVLAAQRDALVPKLVGGEIRTKDVSGFLDTVRS